MKIKINPKGVLSAAAERKLVLKAAKAGMTVKEYKAKMKKDKAYLKTVKVE